MGRGGSRPGAGRKTASRRITVSMRVTIETKTALDELRGQGIHTGQLIDRLVADYVSTKRENDISMC